MGAAPNIPKPVAPPPPPDTTGAQIRELARSATDRGLRAGRGRKNAFLTLDSPAQGSPITPQIGAKPKLGI